MPGPNEVAKIVERLIADGLKISNYTAEPKQDGLHLTVSMVIPWLDTKKP
jgi:hypothetical protein